MSGADTTTETGESSTSNKNTHTSTTSLTQSIEKLDDSMATGQSNYNAWRFRIIRILKEKDLLEAIDEATVSSTKDDQAFTIITLNIKDSQIPHIQDATTASAAWASLKEVHQGIGTNGRMVLMQRLWALKMAEGQDMAQHLNQFRELANQLRGLLVEGKHQQKIYSSSCASDAQDAQDAQDVNSHSGCDVDRTPRPEDSLNVPLRPDNVLKRTLRPVHPDAFRR